MTPRRMLKVFLSSTWQDLREERATVVDSLSRMGLGLIGMEVFGSSPRSPLVECLAEVERSDFFVLIVGHRYGEVGPNRLSFVESEYKLAIKKGIPVFVYFKDEQTPVLPSYVEQSSHKATRLRLLKNRITKKHVVSWFSTPQDLARIVVADLHKYIMDNYLEDYAPLSGHVSLLDILPKGMIELVLEGLSQRFQAPMGLFAESGGDEFYLYPEHLHFTGYCKLIRERRAGLDACVRSDKMMARKCMQTGMMQVYRSHNQLWDFAYPISTGNRVVGVIFTGQICQDPLSPSIDAAIRKHASEIGANPDAMVQSYEAMPVRTEAYIQDLHRTIGQVLSYFGKLAREKSVYATEVGSVGPRSEELRTYAWDTMSTEDIVSIVGLMTEEEFTLRLLAPCLERAGFEGVRCLGTHSEPRYDLQYEYVTPMGDVIHYGAYVLMGRIEANSRRCKDVEQFLSRYAHRLAWNGLECTPSTTVMDQLWIICPFEVPQDTKQSLLAVCDRRTTARVHFLDGQCLVDKLKRFVPILLDNLIRSRRQGEGGVAS